MGYNRVLFVIPRTFADYPGALNPHLGIGYLIAVLEKNKIETDVFDMQLGYSFEALLDKIKQFKPDILGVTMFSFNFIKTYELINKLKNETNLPITLGGCHVSSYRKRVLEATKADFAVFGEGELAMLELCQGKPLNKIYGLIYRSNNEIIENQARMLVQNLDSLPFPAYERFELERYSFYIDKRLPITTSRGCPYLCVYCSANLTVGRGFRARSPENVLAEIEHWYNIGFRSFEFVDDCYNFDIARAKKICDLLIEKQKAGMKIEWRCGSGIRADRVDEELLTKMKTAGCIFTSYGLETGSPEILKRIKKAITLKKAEEAFTLTKKVGITFSVNFIIGHPDETYNKAMESINFAEYLADKIGVDYVNFHNMIPYPGTELYIYIKEHGRFLLPEETYLTEVATKKEKPIFETPEFTYKERIKALKKGFRLTRKTHLQCRLGKTFGLLVYQFARFESTYFMGRKFVMSLSVGRRMF